VKEIDSNKEAWSKLSEDHYNTFKTALASDTLRLNKYIQKELGDVSGKKIIHLQCNTGADTLVLAKTAAHVTGVDLVPENIYFARKLAEESGFNNADFIESDIMKLSDIHREKYDIVFTSEGVLGWLPDLKVWARTIRNLLKDDGFLYVFDSHPFFLSFDESKLDKEIYEIKYPYFGKAPDVGETIGGYASEVKHGVRAYFWMHTISDIINSLSGEGLHIELFNEFTENFFNSGNMPQSGEQGLYQYGYNTDKYPMSFSLKATVHHG
jgi:SAM-dependent methyltransferase